ncbi:hypothetical protein LTR40_007482, partial [Exophiala xenobiotica]
IVDILTQFLNNQAAEEQRSHVTNLPAYLVQVAGNYDFEVTSMREIVDNITEFMTTQPVGQQRTHANTSIRPRRLLAVWASTVSAIFIYTECPFSIASLYFSILAEPNPTDPKLYDKCADAIIADDDIITQGAKLSMIHWLEGNQREGTKALLTRPQETTVPPTEDTPVSSGDTALSTQNNPLAPTPFEPIDPVELLAYEEPTLVDNEAEWPAFLELKEDLDVLYNGAKPDLHCGLCLDLSAPSLFILMIGCPSLIDSINGTAIST